MQQISRLRPAMSVRAYKTYEIATPLSTHWTAATCEQAACEHYLNGWAIRVENLTPEDLHLVKTAGRSFRTVQVAEGETWLAFEPGQPCFKAGSHMRRLERPELFLTRAGDWRGDPTGRGPQAIGAQSWVDDCGENQESLAAAIERG